MRELIIPKCVVLRCSATAVAELQAEALACGEEMGRQLARAELLEGRAAAATAEAAEMRRQLSEQVATHTAVLARMEEELRRLRDQSSECIHSTCTLVLLLVVRVRY